MLTALILICSTAVASDIGDCTAESARTVMRVPAEFGNPITCYMQAQAYVAETSFGQELGWRRIPGLLRRTVDARDLHQETG
jgi:hypothetical protein